MPIRILAAALSLAVASCSAGAPAYAAELPATPATFAAVFLAAQPGDVVKVTGMLGSLALYGNVARQWPADNPVTIDASGATFTSLRLDGFAGLRIDDASFQGGGLRLVGGHDFTISGTRCVASAPACIVLANVHDAKVVNTRVSGALADGIDIARPPLPLYGPRRKP